MPKTKNIKYCHTVRCYWTNQDYGKHMTKTFGLYWEKVICFPKKGQEKLICKKLQDGIEAISFPVLPKIRKEGYLERTPHKAPGKYFAGRQYR